MDIQEALGLLVENDSEAGDGKYLELIAVGCGLEIREWGLAGCWLWEDWPQREETFSGVGPLDIGIDAVGRREDGGWVAIQCKAKGRDAQGKRYTLTKEDIAGFGLASGYSPVWAERWIVTNAEESPTVAELTTALGEPDNTPRIIDIHAALRGELEARQRAVAMAADPRTAMQAEAVARIVKGLERMRCATKHEGWRKDESRGYVVMPCGTGKTRVGFLAACEMTGGRGLAAVLAPSIGLVAQIRRAWLQMADDEKRKIEILAVCSDETAGTRLSRQGEDTSLQDDPTLDRSLLSDSNVAGKIARSAERVSDWLEETRGAEGLRVIVSTYQSAHHTAAGLKAAGERVDLMIGDEAHRTAGIRRVQGKARRERLRQFTMCHDSEAFPARTRLYMTATPRIYSLETKVDDSKWEVRTMDDERTFGVECFRLSYGDAVEQGFLSDYRIIALGLPEGARDQADEMARRANEKRREAGQQETATASLALRKLAYGLAIAGGVPAEEGCPPVSLHSSIAFCNRIAHSREMADELNADEVKNWVAEQIEALGQTPKDYWIEHRDAGDGSHAREEALTQLAEAAPEKPYGLSNVGIFGEGTDSPGLTAVAFVEPRKSPVDVVQAVGRVMRRAPGKELGYIVVPVVIPPGLNAETWLETCDGMEGWRELGQILNALRAHDGRIETRLADLMRCYLPAESPEPTDHLVTIQADGGKATTYIFTGLAEDIETALAPEGRKTRRAAAALKEAGDLREIDAEDRLRELPRSAHGVDDRKPAHRRIGVLPVPEQGDWEQDARGYDPAPVIEEHQAALRDALIKARTKAPSGATLTLRTPKRTAAGGKKKQPVSPGTRLLWQLDLDTDGGRRVLLNILENSGLTTGPKRDMNILQNTVEAAAALLRNDELEGPLGRELGMARLRPAEKGKARADACTVAALLITNAALMHVRLARGGAVPKLGKNDVADIAASNRPAEALIDSWNTILDRDYRPIFWRARQLLLFVTRDERKTAALDAAIRRIARDAELIADTYAEMGMDHAGELFSRVMGDQRSDGAYFTRPLAATMLAEMALHATGETEWSKKETYNRLAMFDPACGSGTLLVAWLSGLKRRASAAGAGEREMRDLHRRGVETLAAGLDINEVSLQLAGAQLSLGDARARYGRMELHAMPYGDEPGGGSRPAMAGSLELLTDTRIVEAGGTRQAALELRGVGARGRRLALEVEEREELEDQIDIVKGRRAALMNPPFVTRVKLAERFEEVERKRILERIDNIQDLLEQADPSMRGITDKNSTGPLYVALGLKTIDPKNGVLGTIIPTIGLMAPIGLAERKILARELHVRWVITCHQPGNTHLSQATGINESLVIGVRDRSRIEEGTKFVSLDSWPENKEQAVALCAAIASKEQSPESVPGGRVVIVSQAQMETGDWSACGWRNPVLADIAREIGERPGLVRIEDVEGLSMAAPGGGFSSKFALVPRGDGDAGILKSKGMEGQTTIAGRLDADIRLRPKPNETEKERQARARKALEDLDEDRAFLLISAGQDTQSARVCAVATPDRQFGTSWMPLQGVDLETAKAWAVWINSTPGRISLLRHRGKKLAYPVYRPAGVRNMAVPHPENKDAIWILAAAWDETQDEIVPSYREGRTPVRELWDDAAARVLGIDRAEIGRWADILNSEPYVSREGFEESLLKSG